MTQSNEEMQRIVAPLISYTKNDIKILYNLNSYYLRPFFFKILPKGEFKRRILTVNEVKQLFDILGEPEITEKHAIYIHALKPFFNSKHKKKQP